MKYKLIDLTYQKKAIDPEVMLQNLKQDFEIKKSVGIWYFTPGGGRFHERFVPEASIEQRIEMAAKMAQYGITGIEAHYPAEINEDNVQLYEQLYTTAGIRVVTIPFSHFYEKDFEFGSMSNPDERIREKAKQIAIGGLKMVQRMGANCAISWPGMDGYRYLHGKPFMYMWDLFETTLAAAMDEVPGVRVAIEPKGYEPAPNNIYRTTAEGILAAQRIERKLKNPVNKELLQQGYSLVALNPEVGHVKMSFEILPAAYSLCAMEGRLAHTHWNSQPDGNYDQDNNIGVVNPHESEALFYACWAFGYREYFGIDINPENMPVEKAIAINSLALDKFKQRVSRYPHEQIIDCHLNPAKNRGKLEEILLQYF